MSKFIDSIGKTKEEAVQKALDELQVSENEVSIEVLQEAEQGGLFGIGKKPAKVRVYVLEDTVDFSKVFNEPSFELNSEDTDLDEIDVEKEAVYYGDDEKESSSLAETLAMEYLEAVFSHFNIDATINMCWEEGNLNVHVTGEDPNMGILIGRRGDTLKALQLLLSFVVNRLLEDRIRVFLDVADYKKRHKEILEHTARKYAKEVRKRHREFVMEPMSASDRRIVHFALQNFRGVKTTSEGVEPHRSVVIMPTLKRDA